MKTLRWIFLVLYALILIGLFGYAYSSETPKWMQIPFDFFRDKCFWTVFVLVVTMISQVLFMFSTGKIDLQRPKNKFLLLVPIAAAAIALAFLTFAFIASATEFLRGNADLNLFDATAFWALIVVSWVVWGIVFFFRFKNSSKYEMFKNIILTLIAGSMLEFLPAVFMHMVTSKRHDCFAGAWTGIGISFGLIVMLWSFGPGIIFLFIEAKDKAELREKSRKIKQ